MKIIKPLTQLREMISKALSGQTNLSKSFQWFRMNFRKKFDWISFNQTLVPEGKPNRRTIAIDPAISASPGRRLPV